METVLEAMARLREAGYPSDLTATAGGVLWCGACSAGHEPEAMTVDELVRFEGVSDPDDQAILLALRCDAGRGGLYVAGFGLSATHADAVVLRRLA